MTCFGLNNEGELIFEYNVETNDTIGTQNVYNGKNSLLWQNFENAFSEEIKETYNSLRDSDKLTYENVLKVLEGEQIDILSEAQYNEDAKYKYLDPLLNDNISTYLYIAQGSRENHLKYWLFNRFNYMDSKYIASDYKDNYATMRLYTPENWSGVQPNASFTITPFANQYSTVKFGSYIVSVRGNADESATVTAPNIEFNDTETIIYGANRISSLGDLSNKYAGTVDMSKATQLTELLIGSNASGYSNTNLKTVSVGNNKLLRKIDVRNCPNLTAPLDLSQCDNIQEVYATGTSITSVKFSGGTELRTLEIPNTITNLTLINKLNLTSITSEGYDSLNTLRIENSAMNPFTIISNCDNLEFVRLIDINCQTTVNMVKKILSLKGMDDKGDEIPISQAITGTITLATCSTELENEFKIALPNVTFKVLSYSKSYTVTFVDGDGNTLYTTSVLENDEAVYIGDTPTKTSTAQYNYTWNGWDRQLKPIMSDCTINATFNNILRYYTVKFINSDTLEVVKEESLGYGTIISKPTIPDGANTWVPADTTVTGNITFYSKYIPYPEDLSVFTFYSTTQLGQSGYTVKHNTTTLPSLLIYPFQYLKSDTYYPVVSICGNSNYNASAVTEVYVPETIEILSRYAFNDFTNIKELDLPNIRYFTENETKSTIEGTYYHFYGCTSLEKVSLPKLQTLPASSSSSCAAFKSCTNLKYVTMGSPEYPFHTWKEYSSSSTQQHFYNSTSNLNFINLVTKNGLESDVTFNYAISSTVKSKIIYSKTPVEIGTTDDGFDYMSTNDSVKIMKYNGSDTIITIPDEIDGVTVTELGDNCFNSNTTITEVTIPNSITIIGSKCFYNCSSLTSITGLPNATSLGSYCFSGCSSLTSITGLDNATSLGNNCFYNCSALTSIDLPNVTSLGNSCFSYCSALTSIDLPNVTSLGNSCFSYCKNLTSITGLDNVTTLGSSCFYNCSALTSIDLPNVTSLGSSCFSYCKNLTSITGLDNVTTLGSSCFSGCSSLTSIDLPNATSLGSYCFEYCSALTSIDLPNVTSLGNSCFYGCIALTSVTFGYIEKPISDTSNFSTSALNTYITTLSIYVTSPSSPPTLTGSPWGATNATITYKQA